MMTKRYQVDVVTDAAEWNALFATVGTPHMTQTWAYGEAKRSAVDWHRRRVMFDVGGWLPRRLVFSRDGRPVAVCQLLEKQFAGVGLASRLNRGPLFLGADNDEQVVRDIYALLRERTVRRNRPLILAPALPDAPEAYRLLQSIGYRPRHAPGWVSDRMDLRPDEQQLRSRLRKRWRQAMQRAEKAGVEFHVCESTEDREWVLERHAEHMKESRFVGMSPAFLEALRKASSPNDLVVTQVCLDGERLGGLITYRFAGVAEGLILWTGPEGRRVEAGRYLDWRTALEMKRRGCEWLDLGGKRAGATATFKEGMGGIEYRLLNEWIAF